jgi:hypothetical protein
MADVQRSDITVPPPPTCPKASIGPAASWVYGRDPGCCTSKSFRGTGMHCNVTCAEAECAKAKMVWRPENTSIHPYECCHTAAEVPRHTTTAAATAAGRERFLLDDGWRFCGGSGGPGGRCPGAPSPAPESGCPAAERAKFIDKPGMSCQGLQKATGAHDETACLTKCCSDASCAVWQYSNSSGNHHTCWLGQCTGPLKPGVAWVGGERPPPPSGPSPPSGLAQPCTDPRCMPQTNDSDWRQVDLPHDFVVEGTFSAKASKSQGYLPFGVGWYRRHIAIPASAANRAIWLDFDGAQALSTVWLDGEELGGHASGYTPFRFNLNASRLAGRTVVLAVRVDATKPDSWWYDGGGIYRSVWLTIASPVHIEPWGVYAPALVGSNASITDGHADAALLPSVEIANWESSAQDVMVHFSVFDERGEVQHGTPASVTAAPGDIATVNETAIALVGAKLWSLESPSLYTLVCSLVVKGVTVDSVNTTFGVRKTVFDPQRGFFLNDVPTKILGCANHQDFAGVGVAVPDALQLHRVAKLKEFGSNAWRTAHNAPNEGLLNAADKLGFLVWDENHRSTQPDEAAILVKRDRNHPSVIIWSVCNEKLCDSHTNNGSAVKAVFKKLDPLMGRPTSANCDAGQHFPPPAWYLETEDLVGFDYGTTSCKLRPLFDRIPTQ